MYNSDLKRKFLSERIQNERTAVNYINMFERAAKFESEWGHDICCSTTEELQGVIDNLYKGRALTQESFIANMRDYIRWCVANNVPGAVDLTDGIGYSPAENFRETTVSGPLHLKRFLDEICSFNINQNTVENIYRSVYWLAFGGVSRSEIMKVLKSDIDFGHMVICHGENKQEYPLYRESLDVMTFAVQAKEFNYYHPLYRNVIVRDRVDSELLITGIKKIDHNMIMSELCRRNNIALTEGRTTQRLSYDRIKLSGIFYRMREMETAGYDIDYIQIVENMLAENGGKKQISRKSTTDKIRDLKIDYDRWKIAYGFSK